MSETAITSKGRMTIPKEIRDRLGLEPGQRIACSVLPDGAVLLRVKHRELAAAAGRLHRKGRRARPVDQLSR